MKWAASDASPARNWKRLFVEAGGNDKTWNEFLADVGLVEADLTRLLRINNLPDAQPAWAPLLERLLNRLQVTPLDADGLPLASALTVRVVQFAWDELLKRLPQSHLQLLPKSAGLSLRESLFKRLVRLARFVADYKSMAVSCDNDAKDPNRVAGVELLTRYPVLARLWSTSILGWGESISELVACSEQFLRDRAGKKVNSVGIETLRGDLSDLHRGNRTVFQLRLTDGTTWFVKPRSGQHELGWFALLEWLNRQGFSHPFKSAHLICLDNHCWMEGITWRPCRSQVQAKAYFYRAGAILYLTHILRAVDLHAGNLVAHASDPVIVDCETLLHPRTRRPMFAREQERGILRTGLLPPNAFESTSVDGVSGFGRRALGPHLVRVRGRPVFAADFADQIVAGFFGMNAFLNAKKYKAIRRKARSCLPHMARTLYKPTNSYERFLSGSLVPNSLRNGLERSVFLHGVCRDGITPRKLVPEEVAALENGDIPIFYRQATNVRDRPTARAMSESARVIRSSLGYQTFSLR